MSICIPCRRLHRPISATKLSSRRHVCYPLVSVCKLLVRNTCIQLPVGLSGVNAALNPSTPHLTCDSVILIRLPSACDFDDQKICKLCCLLVIFIHRQLVKQVKKKKKELNYILTKVDAILIQILMFKVAQS